MTPAVCGGLSYVTICVMKKFLQLALFVTVFIYALALAGCPGPRPASPDQNQNGNVQDTTVDPAHPNEQATGPQDVEMSIGNVGMDLLAKLGYDTTTLEVISMEFSPADFKLLWNVKIGNELGIVADFNINEETLKFEFLSFIFVRDGVLAPSSLGPDDSPLERIAGALGLEEEGYRLVVEKEAKREYRKYATWYEWQIAVSHAVIIAPPDEDAAILFDYRENELIEPVIINIDRDAAISEAKSQLVDPAPGIEPSRVDLIQLPSEPYGSTDFRIYWEVVYGDQVVHIPANDGSASITD